MYKKRKLFVPDDTTYATPFLGLFDLTRELEKADVVMFTGGCDVDPSLYNEPRGKITRPLITRDLRELELFKKASALNKKFLGICRGAQLLCVLAGGKLAQHIEGHNHGYHKYHQVMTNEGLEFQLNSLHHQMMIPGKVDHELIAWTEKLSEIYLDGNDKPIEGISEEPEVVFFPKIKALGIQCHPEWGFEDHAFDDEKRWLKKLIQERLF